MIFFVQIKKHIKATLLKTFLVTMLFVFVYQIYNIEIIRSSIDDRAFDIVNMLYLLQKNTYSENSLEFRPRYKPEHLILPKM